MKNGPHPIVFTAAGMEGVSYTPAASEVRDTTGAGDAFNAGYLAFRLLGSTPLQAIGMGQELAREVIAVVGARVDRSKLRELFMEQEGFEPRGWFYLALT